MKNYEDNIFNYILIALTCLNIFLKGSIVLVVFCLYNFFFVKQKINGTALLLFFLAFSVTARILLDQNDIFNELVKASNYVLPYMIGFNGYTKANNKSLYIKRTLVSVFIGYNLHVLLMFVYNLIKGSSGRTMISIWTNEPVAVTLIGLLSSFIVGYALSIIIFDSGKWTKIVCVGTLILVIAVNMQTATRTPFILMLVTGAVLFIITQTEDGFKNQIKYLMIFSFIIFLIVIVFALNIFNVRDIFLSSDIIDRFSEEGMETGRWTANRFYISKMLDYPFGGGEIQRLAGGRYAHNIWLQCYDEYGAIPFVFMVIITVSFIKIFIKIARMNDKTITEYILLSIYFTTLLQLALEPVMTGYPILFWIQLLIHGMATQHYKDVSIESKKIKKVSKYRRIV